MRILPHIGFVVACSAALAAVANPSGAAATRAATTARPSPGRAFVFVSAYFTNSVYAYDTAGRLVATLGGFNAPSGLATDASGTLYVADTGNSRVQVYRPPYNGKPTTLSDGQEPEDVAVDASGNVAVTNYETSYGRKATIDFYAKGSTKPTRVISSKSFAYFDFCAFDKAGNLFLDGFGATAEVGEVVGGIRGTSITNLTTGNALAYAGGVGVTKTGLISILDSQRRAIYSYDPPTNGNLGSPIQSTSLSGASNPLGIAFAPDNTHVAVADVNLGELLVYRFPAGGLALAGVTLPGFGRAFGVAIVPTEQY